jgi:hypothetical protein
MQNKKTHIKKGIDLNLKKNKKQKQMKNIRH